MLSDFAKIAAKKTLSEALRNSDRFFQQAKGQFPGLGLPVKREIPVKRGQMWTAYKVSRMMSICSVKR